MKRAKLILTESPYIQIEGTKIDKPIDYNDIDFGIVDLDKLAEDSVQEVKPNNTDFFVRDVYKEFFIEGFKASQQLNEKKFTSEDMIEFTEFVGNLFKKVSMQELMSIAEKSMIEIVDLWQSKKSANTFEVEIEETETNIKIIKKL